MKVPLLAAYVSLALLVPSANPQMPFSLPGGSMRFDGNGNLVTAAFTFRVPLQPPPLGFLPDRPYSAEEISQDIQILSDGTRIVRSSPSNFFYRDSAGRTRTERHFPSSPLSKHAEVPAIPEIFDPVAGCIYFLDVAKAVAHRVELPQPIKVLKPPQGLVLPPMPVMMNPAQGANPFASAETMSEPLGAKEIEGIQTQGRRTTRIYPAGTAGNDRPVSITTEIWTSPELNAVILSKVTDPRQGDKIQVLTNIIRAEPNAGLFQVPQGYKVVNETGPFTITIKGPGSR